MTVGIVIKGLIMGLLVAAVDLNFVKSLVLVIVSALVTGAFAVLVAKMQIRAQVKVHERIDQLETRQRDIAGAVGVAKRVTDEASS